MARSFGIRRDREYWLNQIQRKILDRGVSDLGEIREDIQGRIGEQRSMATEEEERHTKEVAEENRLYKAICDNNWEIAKALLEEKPNALTSTITAFGETPFHVAAFFGHANIMEELLKLLENPEFLETIDHCGYTPLLAATVTGSIEVAKCLVDKNSYPPCIPYYPRSELPVTSAFVSGHHEMGHYLYSQTRLEYLQPRHLGHPLGPTLLRCCLQTQRFDIAHHLLTQCQELLFASDEKDWKPIHGIISMTSKIPSPTELVFWKRWIYDDMDTNSTPSFQSASLPTQNEDEDTRERKQGKLTGPVAAGHRLLRWLIFSAYNFRGIKKIKEMKLQQAKANKLVDLVCRNASNRYEVQTIADALFLAAKEGNVEFVVKISKANPGILLRGDDSFRNIFHHAIQHRQAGVFNLIHGLRFKDVFATSKDKDGNTLLHAAAAKAPGTILNRIYGPALQMQRELQWFKEVEGITPPNFRVLQNSRGAFTVAGGNDENIGYPLFIKQPFFKVFIFSTILSLLSSSTSVLMFSAILTSKYSEEKFLKSLPTKLILGLFVLFISIVSMIVAFLSTIRLMLKHTNYSWGLLPIIIFASVPIFLFVLSQFPLLLHTFVSTYGTIFDRKVKPWP
ncbi:uncharacterized protein LOC114721450 [Neltuma alba]|uniref:uncharacterized protein LOC114721450 n=1 Tax=Neltuma alba TaxID=207710 RepID=UPI0010A506CA|nr:uncharacterized protein LOC114721450 [Prosopis alba]